MTLDNKPGGTINVGSDKMMVKTWGGDAQILTRCVRCEKGRQLTFQDQ